MLRKVILFSFAAGLLVTEALSQNIAVSPHIGTLGIGVDAGVSIGSRAAVRAGFNLLPASIDIAASDIDFTIDLPSPQYTLLADVLLVGSLRATGGLLISPSDITSEAVVEGIIEIGDVEYTPEEVGNLTGAIRHKDVAPYLGIGLGNPRKRLGFFMDLGVAFHGRPEVELAADGPIRLDPEFQTELEIERSDAEEDIRSFMVYPVLSVGVSIRVK